MSSTSSTPTTAGQHKSRLRIVFILTVVYLLAEVVGGYLTGSLALLADAGHMLTDVAGLGMALFAIQFAERPATPERTYGYYRVEVLAALANAVVLIGISAFVLFEAYSRFQNPPAIAGGPVVIVAVIGLLVNLVGIVLLHAGSTKSLNLKGAYFEVLSDLLTSIGVIIAGAIIWATGWYYADPLISAGIGLFILPRTWILLRDAVGVLLEGTPADVNLVTVRESLTKLAGVVGVHDLHVWSLTSGVNAMSVHVVLADDSQHDDVLTRVNDTVKSNFKIDHTTVQIELKGCQDKETHL